MHDAAAPSLDGATPFTLRQAAAALGVSLNTLRKRIADGQIRAERVERPQGHVWRVYLDGADRSIHPPDGTVQEDGAGTVQDPPTDLMRAEAMAAYTRSLLEPLTAALERSQGRVAELERDTGRLTAEVTTLNDRLAAAESSRRREHRRLRIGLAVVATLALAAGLAPGWVQ